jgi:hypothetical protein
VRRIQLAGLSLICLFFGQLQKVQASQPLGAAVHSRSTPLSTFAWDFSRTTAHPQSHLGTLAEGAIVCLFFDRFKKALDYQCLGLAIHKPSTPLSTLPRDNRQPLPIFCAALKSLFPSVACRHFPQPAHTAVPVACEKSPGWRDKSAHKRSEPGHYPV